MEIEAMFRTIVNDLDDNPAVSAAAQLVEQAKIAHDAAVKQNEDFKAKIAELKELQSDNDSDLLGHFKRQVEASADERQEDNETFRAELKNVKADRDQKVKDADRREQDLQRLNAELAQRAESTENEVEKLKARVGSLQDQLKAVQQMSQSPSQGSFVGDAGAEKGKATDGNEDVPMVDGAAEEGDGDNSSKPQYVLHVCHS
jgi:DNA repair exonuclease SbcCD ATPase subunit